MASNDVIVNIKFNVGFEGDLPDASTPEGAALRATILKAINAPSILCVPVRDIDPLEVTDEEAMVASRAMCDFVETAVYGDPTIVSWGKLDEEVRKEVAHHVKASLAAGHFLAHSSDALSVGTPADRNVAAYVRRQQLAVARAAVLTRRAVRKSFPAAEAKAGDTDG